MNHYRFAAYCFVLAVTLIATWFILRSRVWNPNMWHWIVLIIVVYSIINWFVNIQADAA